MFGSLLSLCTTKFRACVMKLCCAPLQGSLSYIREMKQKTDGHKKSELVCSDCLVLVVDLGRVKCVTLGR